MPHEKFASFDFSGFSVPLVNLDQGFVAEFSVRITSAGNPADGFAVNFGQPIATRVLLSTMGGFERGLNVEFDNFGGGDPQGVRVRADGVEQTFEARTVLDDGALHNIAIWMRPVGSDFRVSLTIDETVRGFDVTDYAASPEDMVAFSAKTGGLFQNLSIDALEVSAVPEPALGLSFGAALVVLISLGRRRHAQD